MNIYNEYLEIRRELDEVQDRRSELIGKREKILFKMSSMSTLTKSYSGLTEICTDFHKDGYNRYNIINSTITYEHLIIRPIPLNELVDFRNKLDDYLSDLGCTQVWKNPPKESTSS